MLAGEGDLPLRLVDHALTAGIPVCVIHFNGCDYAPYPAVPILKTPIERVGDIFRFLKNQSVTDVVLIGNLKRPKLSSLRPDWQGLKTLGRIAGAFAKGDNDLLTTLKDEIERQGYRVRGIDYFLSDLTCKSGTLTGRSCTVDLTKGIAASRAHGIADKGQSVLLHPDGTLSYEDQAGTNALIHRHGRAGSILIKTIKPQQNPDLDRPTVGLDTVIFLSEKGCSGMAIQAGEVIFVNRDEAVAYANEHGLFIEVFDV